MMTSAATNCFPSGTNLTRGSDTLADDNVQSVALQLPSDLLTRGDGTEVIRVWLPRTSGR